MYSAPKYTEEDYKRMEEENEREKQINKTFNIIGVILCFILCMFCIASAVVLIASNI